MNPKNNFSAQENSYQIQQLLLVDHAPPPTGPKMQR